MTFSIIIPVHNGEKYLKDTVESVLGQIKDDDAFSAEILLVENASEDDSPIICDRFASEHNCVTSFHQGRLGAYGARRFGMEKAQGDWLVFADADDEMCQGGLSKLWRCIASFPDYEKAPDIILYNWNELKNEGGLVKTYPFEAMKVYWGVDKRAFYDLMCDGDSINAPWNKCIKRSLALKALEKEGAGFLNHGEDLLQTAEFLDLSKGILYLDEVIYSYRDNNEGLTGRYHKEFLENQETAWEKFDAYAEKWAEGTDRYRARIDARKSLTCAIAVKSLLYYSGLKVSTIKGLLKELMDSSFYKKYASLDLPQWACEEDVFVHGLMTGDNAYGRLVASGRKHAFKHFIKERIGR